MSNVVNLNGSSYKEPTPAPEPTPVYTPAPQQIVRVHLIQPEPSPPSTGQKAVFMLGCCLIGLVVGLAMTL